MRSRLIIHAGFGKCGNASIRVALFQNFRQLQRDGVLIFDKNLIIARRQEDLIGTSIWSLERARDKAENLTNRLGNEIAASAKRKPHHLSILSAENLANPSMAELFAGLDRAFDVLVVFFVRPQMQWIPSAWKQWGIKTGVSLEDFVSECIENHRPSFRAVIEAWKNALPAAEIHVRFLLRDLLAGETPAQDFFQVIGLSPGDYKIDTERRNPSLDVSILHVLSKNPQLFRDIHDNDLTLALTRALPEKFRSTNIQMLSAQQEARIEQHFREENFWLLNTYCSGKDIDHLYRTHFMPHKGELRYSDLSDTDLIYRCLATILESIAFNGAEPVPNRRKRRAPDIAGETEA